MSERGPANGYYWTQREMMMRRDHIRWQRRHTLITWSPLAAMIVGFPLGAAFGGLAWVVSWGFQAHQLHSPFADSRYQYSRPLAIQRVMAYALLITGFLVFMFNIVWAASACTGACVWMLLLQYAEKSANEETEIQRANREATHVEETWIKE
jgi:hypothetical protein